MFRSLQQVCSGIGYCTAGGSCICPDSANVRYGRACEQIGRCYSAAVHTIHHLLFFWLFSWCCLWCIYPAQKYVPSSSPVAVVCMGERGTDLFLSLDLTDDTRAGLHANYTKSEFQIGSGSTSPDTVHHGVQFYIFMRFCFCSDKTSFLHDPQRR